MAFTYDVSTNRGQVRLLIGDTDSTKPIFFDDEIDKFLELEGSIVRCGAALALETMASNASLLEKFERIADYEVDSKGMASKILEVAKRFREGSTAAFAIAQQNLTTFSESDILWKDILKKS